MKKLLALLILIAPMMGHAEITGPATSTTGDFTLEWSNAGRGNSFLAEITSTGQRVATWQASPTRVIKNAPGYHYFEETFCGFIPFVGNSCFPVDTHQVTVSTGVPEGTDFPQAAWEQGEYRYQVRTGDFDGNGTRDIFVERLTAGPADGSMQSYIVLNNGGGRLSTVGLSDDVRRVIAARSAPISATLTVTPTDMNADGFTDHFISGLSTGLGLPDDQLLVFAPGMQPDKTRPQGDVVMTPERRAFIADLRSWMNDKDHFRNALLATFVPGIGTRFQCSVVFTDGTGRSICGWTQAPIYQIRFNVNLGAVSVAGRILNLLNSDDPSLEGLRALAQDIQRYFGVPMFGFDPAGNWTQQPNYPYCPKGSQDPRGECARSLLENWIESFARYYTPEIPLPSTLHDYFVRTEICSTQQKGCTLANVACWGRHYHAPNKIAGHRQPAIHSQTYDLVGVGRNPIKVAVGPNFGLPENAIAQITQSGHILHSSLRSNPWPICPKPVPSQGRGAAPSGCNQVYREPVEEGGKIYMQTRGTGENDIALINQLLGPQIMKRLDRELIAASRSGVVGNATAFANCPSAP